MIIDSSVLVAIIKGEDDARRLAAAIASGSRPCISAATWLEAAMVVDRKGNAEAVARFDGRFDSGEIEIIPFTPQQAALARDAWRRFGKGSRHPAQLNFGDCMAYATARDTGQPLLFKGRDFIHTDIVPALSD